MEVSTYSALVMILQSWLWVVLNQLLTPFGYLLLRLQTNRVYKKRNRNTDFWQGLFNFPDLLHTKLKFPVKQLEFAKTIVPVILFIQGNVIISKIYWAILGDLYMDYLFPE